MNRTMFCSSLLRVAVVLLACASVSSTVLAATVATPVFSTPTGTYTGTQTVTIGDSTSGATIYYTTDGSTPTTSSTQYSSAITVTASETVEAIAAVGSTLSTAAEVTYTIVPAGSTGTLSVFISPPDAQSTTVAGALTETFDGLTAGTTYTSLYTWTNVGTYGASSTTPFAIVAPDEYGGATDSSSSTTRTNYFAVGSESTPASTNPVSLALTKPASYFGFWWSAGDANNRIALYSGTTLYGTFSTADLVRFLNGGSGTITASNGTAYQASSYYGNPNLTSNNDNAEPFAYVSFVITGATIDKIAFYNTTTATGFESDNHSVIFSGSTVTIPTTYVPVETLSLSSQAVQPVFSPAGGTYTVPQTVTISTTTAGASINYTLNGTTPSSTNGVTYTVPVTVSQSETLQAIAFETGLTSSTVAAATYTIPVTIAVAPTSATLYAGQTQQFTATVANTSNTAVLWSISPSSGAGSISSSGLYTAPASISTQQSVTITAASQASGASVATATVTLMPPATPTIAWATPAAITYGTALSTAQLDATVNAPGTLAYTPAAGTVLTAGSQTLAVAFTPSNSALYGTASASAVLTVNKATPTVSAWPTASTITYGQTLASSTLTGGTASVAGSFAWTASPTVPGAGTQSQSVTFTPTDTTDYNTVTGSVNVAVTPATLTVTANSVSITAGSAIPQFTDTITGFVNGDSANVVAGLPALGTTATTSSPAGSYPITVMIGTLAAANYQFAFVNGTLTISATTCVSNGYSYIRAITIDHTKVPNTDQTNFPFLFSTTDPLLATTVNGGHVTSANGYDIIFTSDPAGQNQLPYEMEEYTSATGQVVAWVQVPTVSHTTDTVIYLFYGNSSVTTSQQNPTAAWKNHYVGV